MTRGRDALRRIDSPSALSLATWAVAFAPSVTTAVLHDRNLYGGSAWLWLVSAIAGACAAGLVLLVAHLLLGRWHPVPVLIAVFLLAGCARGVGVGGTAFGLGLVPDPQLGTRALSGSILAVFWLSVATIIVGGFREHRATRLELQALQHQAEVDYRQASQQLVDLRARTHEEVTSELHAIALRWSRRAQQGASLNPAQMRAGAEELHDLAAQVVRPLSHDAVTVAVAPATERERASTSRLRAYLTIASDAVSVDPFRPGWVALLLFPSILTTAVRGYGWILGVIGALWIVAMAAAVLWLAQRVITPRLRHWPRGACAIVVLIVWISAGTASAIPVAWSADWGLGPERAWQVFGIPLLAYLPITCLGVAIVTAIAQSWALDADARRARIAAIEWQTERTQQSIWAERKRLGRFLHGSVQSTLTSTALLIESGVDRHDDPSVLAQRAAERLLGLVAAVEDHGHEPVAIVDIDGVLGSIATVWTRLADTRIEIGASAREAYARDADAAERVVEVVREAVANAVRHGRASRIDVDIRLRDDAVLGVTVRDDGSLAPSSPLGMGSALLDELCSSWTRSRQDGWTVLEGAIPTSHSIRMAANSSGS